MLVRLTWSAFLAVLFVTTNASAQTPTISASPPTPPPNDITPSAPSSSSAAPVPPPPPAPIEAADTPTPITAPSTPPPVPLPGPLKPQSPKIPPQSPLTPASIWWSKDFDVPQKPVVQWYGWQTLIVLGATDLTTILSIYGFPSEQAMWGLAISSSAHVLAGPIVHWAHGHTGRGFGALGLNLTLTGVGFAAAILSRFGASENPSMELYAVCVGLGYLAGPAIDIALLSNETVRTPFLPTSWGSRQLWSPVGIVPMLDSNRRGLIFVGQF